MHADKWGPVGSIIAAACCLGLAPIVGALSALGLGFLLNDLILVPLLAFFLAITLFQLHRDRTRHGHASPVGAAWVAAALTLGGIWVHPALVALGLVLLVASSVGNFLLIRRLRGRAGAVAPG